jgi:hypothetical protein
LRARREREPHHFHNISNLSTFQKVHKTIFFVTLVTYTSIEFEFLKKQVWWCVFTSMRSVRNSWVMILQLVIARSFTARAFSPSYTSIGFRRTEVLTRRIVGATGTNSIVVRQLSSQDDSSESSQSSDESKQNGIVDPDDKLAEFRNENNRDDQVFSAMSKDGSVKVTACTVRNLINDMMIMHTMTATPSDALGRTVVCALLMSNGIQPEQTVQLTVNGKRTTRPRPRSCHEMCILVYSREHASH